MSIPRIPVVRGALIGLACSLICMGLSDTMLVKSLENWMLDGSFIIRGERSTKAPITIVAIDDESITRLEKPLSFISPELAQVITYLDQGGATAIGIDLLIPDTDRAREFYGPDEIGDAETVGHTEVAAEGSVVLPVVQSTHGNGELGWLKPLTQWQNPLNMQLLMSESEESWCRFGCVNLSVDDDTYVRSQQLVFQNSQDDRKPHLALALWGVESNRDLRWFDTFATSPGESADSKRIRINYVGPPESIQSVPFHRVHDAALTGTQASEWRDKIVIIGVTADSQKDRRATPYSNETMITLFRRYLMADDKSWGDMSGSEIHANTLATLIDQRYITTPVFLSPDFVLILTGLVLGGVLWNLRLMAGVLLLIGHHLTWRFAALSLFTAYDWHLEVVSVFLLEGLLFAGVFAGRWRLIRRALALLKSEEIAKAILRDPRKLSLHGEDREITIMFSDIRGFTSFSAAHTPGEVVTLLNTYFSTVIPVIQKHGGIVNQYMGDGLMIIFGAPNRLKDHANCAVEAAVDVLRTVHEADDLWQSCGANSFRIGIGICTGRTVIGTIGSRQRLDYTAIGDSVNAAARIEALNKELKTEILVADVTLQAMKPEHRSRWENALGEPHHQTLRGRTEEMTIYPVTVDLPT